MMPLWQTDIAALQMAGSGVIDAGVHNFHAARHVSSHYIASGLVEHWFCNTGVCGAQCFPISKRQILGRHESVPYQARPKLNLGLVGIELILSHDLRAKSRDVFTLQKLVPCKLRERRKFQGPYSI
jgi:hypothetical protein